jgi:hypothetical protein
MHKRILIAIAVIGGVGFLLVGILVFWFFQREGRLTGTREAEFCGTTVECFADSHSRIGLLLWFDSPGRAGSGLHMTPFEHSFKGHFSSAGGQQGVGWYWNSSRGAEFQLDGKSYDLTNGALFLVSTRSGQIRVTQLNVDLSQLRPDQQGFESLVRGDLSVAKFVAEATGRRRWWSMRP